MSSARLATHSFQFLRGKAHALLEELFPNPKKRYAWLKRNAPKSHMSELNKEQLITLINKLEKLV